MNTNELEQYKLELIAEHQAEIAVIDRLIARERSKVPGSLNGLGVATTERVRYRRTDASIVKDAIMQLNGLTKRVAPEQHQLQAIGQTVDSILRF